VYVTVPYNKVLFSILFFFTSQSEVDFGIAYVSFLFRLDSWTEHLVVSL
jgi:hypothetical protein